LGLLLLDMFERGQLWDSEIIIVPEKFVPKQEKEFKSPDGEMSDKP
jgi:hypothetical protein